MNNLKAAAAYQFRISAENSVGEGPSSAPSNIVVLPQERKWLESIYRIFVEINYEPISDMYIDLIWLFWSSAPSGPPVGFVGSARSSSEIITQWQPPLDEYRNGHILGYILRYRLHGYSDSPWTMQNITNEAQRNYLITDLITWKDYEVQIAAYNDKGVGVYTKGLQIKTKEGGD